MVEDIGVDFLCFYEPISGSAWRKQPSLFSEPIPRFSSPDTNTAAAQGRGDVLRGYFTNKKSTSPEWTRFRKVLSLRGTFPRRMGFRVGL